MDQPGGVLKPSVEKRVKFVGVTTTKGKTSHARTLFVLQEEKRGNVLSQKHIITETYKNSTLDNVRLEILDIV